jgi:ABC-2 type transport system ATP-binding protein
MAQKDLVILTQGLQKSYGIVQALRGVDLEVEKGQIYGFLGPNGAGKTTTIRCLLDLIRPQAGVVRVLGMDPQVDPVAVRALVGYLPGELNLEPNLTAAGTLRYLNDLRGRTAEWDFVRRLAQRFELDLSMPIRNLSKGNKQKVGVIQAFMSRPELLLLDEPTSGLDPLMQQEVYRLIHDAQADGATIFFSSHIISEIGAIAQRLAIIRGGVIVEEAEPSHLESMTMRRVHVRFQEPIDPAALSNVPGVELLNQNGTVATLQVEGEMDSLLKALAAYPVSDLETERPSLEEIFLAFYKSNEGEEHG